MERITFAEHKELTAKDCEQVAEIIRSLAVDVREGNLASFEKFWVEGGTEEGDAKINPIREMLILRYYNRAESVETGGTKDFKNEK